jgi:hypothetical protein
MTEEQTRARRMGFFQWKQRRLTHLTNTVARHNGAHDCWGGTVYVTVPGRVCEPYALAQLALELHNKTEADSLLKAKEAWDEGVQACVNAQPFSTPLPSDNPYRSME